MQYLEILNEIRTLSDKEHALKVSLQDLYTDLQRPNLDEDKKRNRIKSWLKNHYTRNTARSPEHDRLARELCLYAANDDPKEALHILYQHLPNLNFSVLPDQFNGTSFLNRHYLLKYSNVDIQIVPLPKNWKKAANNEGMMDLFKLWEEAIKEKSKIDSPNLAQQEAFEFLERAEGCSLHEGEELLVRRSNRLSALGLDSATPGLSETNQFWSAFVKKYQPADSSSGVSMDLETHPSLGIEPLSIEEAHKALAQARNEIDKKKYENNASGLSHRILDQTNRDQIDKVLKEYDASNGDIRQFLAKRKEMDKAHGYTASPFSPANIFCARLAWNLVEKTNNPRQQFWNLLYPHIKKTWMGSTDSDWPNYGEAIYTSNGLVNYIKLARMCQYQDVYAILIEKGEPNDPIIKKLLLAHPNYWKFSSEEWQAIRHFNPDEKVFWYAHENEQSEFGPGVKINNIADFFRELKKVLDKYKASGAANQNLAEEMSAKGMNEVRPFLTYLWTSSIIPQLLSAQKKYDKTSEIYQQLTDLIEIRTNLAPVTAKAGDERTVSCFNRNATTLDRILSNTEEKSDLIQYLESDACKIVPRTVIAWNQAESKGSDSRPMAELDTMIISKSLQEVDDPKILFDWIDQCYRTGISLPISPIAKRMIFLADKMTVKDLFNFIYQNTPKGQGASTQSIFFDKNDSDLAYKDFMGVLMSRIFANGIPADKLKTTEDYLCAIKLHNSYGLRHKEKTLLMSINYIEKIFDEKLDDKELVKPFEKLMPLIVLLLSDPEATENKKLFQILVDKGVHIPPDSPNISYKMLGLLFSQIDINNFEKAVNGLRLPANSRSNISGLNSSLSDVVNTFSVYYPEQYRKTLLLIKSIEANFPFFPLERLLTTARADCRDLTSVFMMAKHEGNFEEELINLFNRQTTTSNEFERIINYMIAITDRGPEVGMDGGTKLINQFSENFRTKVLTQAGFVRIFNHLDGPKRRILHKYMKDFGILTMDSANNWPSLMSICSVDALGDFADIFDLNSFLSVHCKNKIQFLTDCMSKLNATQLERLFGRYEGVNSLARIGFVDALKVIISLVENDQIDDPLKISFLFRASTTRVEDLEPSYEQIQTAIHTLTEERKNVILMGFLIYRFKENRSDTNRLLAMIQPSFRLLAIKAIILSTTMVQYLEPYLEELIPNKTITQAEKMTILYGVLERRNYVPKILFQTLYNLTSRHLITPEECRLSIKYYFNRYSDFNDFTKQFEPILFESLYVAFQVMPDWFDSIDDLLRFALAFKEYQRDKWQLHRDDVYLWEPDSLSFIKLLSVNVDVPERLSRSVSHHLARHLLKLTNDFPSNGLEYFDSILMQSIGEYCSMDDAYDLIERYCAVRSRDTKAETYSFGFYLHFITQFRSLKIPGNLTHSDRIIGIIDTLTTDPFYHFKSCSFEDFYYLVDLLKSSSAKYINNHIDFLCELIVARKELELTPPMISKLRDIVHYADEVSCAKLVSAVYSTLSSDIDLLKLVKFLRVARHPNSILCSSLGDHMARFIKIYTLLMEEEIAGKLRHWSDFSTVSQIDVRSEDDWVRILKTVASKHPLISQAWKLAWIKDEDARFVAVYDACFHSNPLNVSQASEKLMLSAFSTSGPSTPTIEKDICRKTYPENSRRAKVQSACLATALQQIQPKNTL